MSLGNIQYSKGRIVSTHDTSPDIAKQRGIKTIHRYTKIFVSAFGDGFLKIKPIATDGQKAKSYYLSKNSCRHLINDINANGKKLTRKEFSKLNKVQVYNLVVACLQPDGSDISEYVDRMRPQSKR